MIQAFLYNDILNTFITTGIIIGYLIVVTIISKIFTAIFTNKLQLNTINNTPQWFYYLSLGFTPILSSIILWITCFQKINLSMYSYTLIFICIPLYFIAFITSCILCLYANLLAEKLCVFLFE